MKKGVGRLMVLFVLTGVMPLSQAETYDELKGKFGAVLVVTDGEVYAPVQSAPRSKKLVGIIKLVGCSPSAEGNCDSEADIRIINPKGALDVHTEHNKLEKQKAPAPGEAITGWVFEISFRPTDPVGKYKIEATVRDRVSGQVIELSNILNITK